jgi:sodium/proline symporter
VSFVLQATFVVYLLALIAIGVYSFFRTETKRLADYMLAGRDVGTWPMAVSDVASIASGWTFFAWVGVGFTVGISGLWFSITMLLVIVVLYRYVGSPFRRQSEELESLTVADHVSVHFEDDRLGPAIRVVVTVAIVVFMTSYVGAQIIAVGEAVDTGIGIEYATAVILGGAAVALYTILGGFHTSIWTDFFQGVLIFLAAVSLPILMVWEVGGWNAFVSEANAADPTLLSMTAGDAGTALAIGILAWVTFAMGTIGQPHSLMRFQAIRSERLFSPASVIAVTFQSLRLTVPLLIGIAGRVLYEDIPDPEIVAMQAIVDLFPALVAGVLLAAIVSAILSTSDSMLIVTASDATRFYETFLRPDASEAELIVLGRLTVLVVAVLGVALAYVRPGTIFEIIEFAYVGLGATYGLALLFVLFWRRTTPTVVLTGVFLGFASSIGNLYLAPDLFPILVWPITVVPMVLVGYLTYDGT